MRPDETDEERLEKLSEDVGRPFDPPAASADDTHPATDSNLDSTEVYQEGTDAAAGVDDPNGSNGLEEMNSEEIEDEAI
jgi:hypothetical protein